MPGSPLRSGRSMHSIARVGAVCGPGEESVDVPREHPDSAAARPTAASRPVPLREITRIGRLRSVIGSIGTHSPGGAAGAAHDSPGPDQVRSAGSANTRGSPRAGHVGAGSSLLDVDRGRRDGETALMSEELGLSAEEVTEAWVYLLGRYLVMRQEALDLAEDGIGYNVLKHNPAIVVGTASDAAPTFVNPNLDVVYSEAWIAVDAASPAILEIPDVPAGHYYTAQIVDEWAEITHNINERNFPDHPQGRYVFCLAGSSPTIPD